MEHYQPANHNSQNSRYVDTGVSAHRINKRDMYTEPTRLSSRDVASGVTQPSRHDIAVGGRLSTHGIATNTERYQANDIGVGGRISRHDIGIGNETLSHHEVGIDSQMPWPPQTDAATIAVPAETLDTGTGTMILKTDTATSPHINQDKPVSAIELQPPKQNRIAAMSTDKIKLEDISTQYDIPRQHPAPEMKGNPGGHIVTFRSV